VTLAIDGSAHTAQNTASCVIALTTTQANDYIIVCFLSNGSPSISVVGSSIGAFTQIGIASRGSSQFSEEIWAKFSPGVLSGENITITLNSANVIVVDVFGVSGSGQASLVFDAGGPQVVNGMPGDPVSLTTTNANTMVIGAFSLASGASNTPGSGFTLVNSGDFHQTEYQVLSSAATTSVALGIPGAADGGVAIAIVMTIGGGGGGGTFVLEPNQQRIVM
jgi:hypothetical protein